MKAMSEDELIRPLTRFHREVFVPDLERIIDERFEQRLTPFIRETNANFDAVFERLDRLDDEMVALRAAVTHLEARMDGVEARLTVIERDLAALKTRVERLDEHMTAHAAEMSEQREELTNIKKRVAALERKLSTRTKRP